jgi:hypothetical protein
MVPDEEDPFANTSGDNLLLPQPLRPKTTPIQGNSKPGKQLCQWPL